MACSVLWSSAKLEDAHILLALQCFQTTRSRWKHYVGFLWRSWVGIQWTQPYSIFGPHDQSYYCQKLGRSNWIEQIIIVFLWSNNCNLKGAFLRLRLEPLGPLLLLPEFNFGFLRHCSLHNLNLGLMATANSGALQLFGNFIHFGCLNPFPGSSRT